jgi:hypothetical protein
MSNERGPSHAVMEGRGAYNKHARLPADGAAPYAPFARKGDQRGRPLLGRPTHRHCRLRILSGKKFASRHDPLSGSLLGFSFRSMVTCTACLAAELTCVLARAEIGSSPIARTRRPLHQPALRRVVFWSSPFRVLRHSRRAGAPACR